MVSIGTLEATVTADARQFAGEIGRADRSITGLVGSFGSLGAGVTGVLASAGALASGIATVGRTASAAIDRLEELSQVVAGEASLARAFGIARAEWVQLQLALESTGQEGDELRDLIGDLQELAGLAGRPGARQAGLLQELGVGAEFAALAAEDMAAAFRVVLDAINRLGRVEARGLLSELVGADASRRLIEVASASGQLGETLERLTGIGASTDAAESFIEAGQAVRELRRALQEHLIQVLADTGALDALTGALRGTVTRLGRLAEQITAFGEVIEEITGRSAGAVVADVVGGAGGALLDQAAGALAVADAVKQVVDSVGAAAIGDREAQRDLRRAVSDLGSSVRDLATTPTVLEAIADALRGRIEVEVTERFSGTRDLTAGERELAAKLDDIRLGIADREPAFEPATLSSLNVGLDLLRDALERNREALIDETNQVAVDIESLQRTGPGRLPIGPAPQDLALQEELRRRQQEAVEAERELAAVQQQRIATLTGAFSQFFSAAQSGIEDLGDAFLSFVRSLLNSLVAEGAARLATTLVTGVGGGGAAGAGGAAPLTAPQRLPTAGPSVVVNLQVDGGITGQDLQAAIDRTLPRIESEISARIERFATVGAV